MLGAVSALDSMEDVGDGTLPSNGDGDDGVVLSKFPKWVTWDLMRCHDIINHHAGIIVTIVLDDDQRK